MPVDDERKRMVGFGPADDLFESTYLVRPGSPIQTIARVDQAGTRVAVIEGTTTARAAARSLKSATLVPVRTVAEIEAMLRAGRADAAALSTRIAGRAGGEDPRFQGPWRQLPFDGSGGRRPEGPPAALACVTDYVQRALASGVVQRALDDARILGRAARPGSRWRGWCALHDSNVRPTDS